MEINDNLRENKETNSIAKTLSNTFKNTCKVYNIFEIELEINNTNYLDIIIIFNLENKRIKNVHNSYNEHHENVNNTNDDIIIKKWKNTKIDKFIIQLISFI